MKSREHQLLKLGFHLNEHQDCYILSKYDKLWYVDFNKITDYKQNRWDVLIDDLIYDITALKKQWYDDLRAHPAYELREKEAKKQILDLLNKYRADLEQVNHFKLDKTVNQEAKIRLEAKVEVLKELYESKR